SIGAIQFTTASAANYDGRGNNRKKLMIQGSVHRFIAGFVIVLIPLLTIAILPLALILIITVICIIQIILDLRHHPHHQIF
ncbi:MAG TPA: hypothetical protein VE076_01715, partial [Nitrososphaeraceae archaeon]|nr:hypothetical protein [Nitrososphaeraceae archaeon]